MRIWPKNVNVNGSKSILQLLRPHGTCLWLSSTNVFALPQKFKLLSILYTAFNVFKKVTIKFVNTTVKTLDPLTFTFFGRNSFIQLDDNVLILSFSTKKNTSTIWIGFEAMCKWLTIGWYSSTCTRVFTPIYKKAFVFFKAWQLMRCYAVV